MSIVVNQSESEVGRSQPLCRAPFTSLHLDPSGHVRVCELNSLGMLGTVPGARLLDLWRGERATRIREALRAHDLGHGCEDCVRPLAAGTRHLAHAAYYDRFDEPGPGEPPWPVQLELSLSNTCNLQCVMCNGDLSSAIRARREHLPPLPHVYDDQFFDDLAQFLPHLERVTFIGGEPFLGAESLRVFDMLIALGRRVECQVTTNGTVFTPRVERILSELPVEVSVSIDGATAATYESIRPGSNFDSVLANLDRFAVAATHLSLNMCLMTVNWWEFGPLLRLADERGLPLHVNTVIAPRRYSLYHLAPHELDEVLSGLRRYERETGPFRTNQEVWERQLRRLGDHRRSLGDGALPPVDGTPDGAATTPVVLTTATAGALAARHADERGVHVLEIGASEQILAIRPDPSDVLGMDLRSHVGGHLTALVGSLTDAFGDLDETTLEYRPGGIEDRMMTFARDGVRTTVRAVLGGGDPSPSEVTSRWHLAARRVTTPSSPPGGE